MKPQAKNWQILVVNPSQNYSTYFIIIRRLGSTITETDFRINRIRASSISRSFTTYTAGLNFSRKFSRTNYAQRLCSVNFIIRFSLESYMTVA